MTKPLAAAVFGVVSMVTSTVGRVQQNSDFSGTWVASTDAPPGVAAAPSPVMGPRFALRAESGAMVLARPTRDDVLEVRFTLDGTASSYRIPGRLCEGEPQVMETLTLDNGTLVLAITGTMRAGATSATASNVKRVMRRVGDTLVVQGTATQAGKPAEVATVYKRSADAMPAPRATTAFSGPAATIADAAWIGATWIGSTASSTVEERWTPPASGGMIGVARMLRGTSLSSFEFLCIAERAGTLVYVAMPDARFPPTYFTLTKFTADSATFENPAHDFPKLIRYTRLPDGSLQTAISGGGTSKETTFVLKKQ